MLFIKLDKYYYFHFAERLTEIMTSSKPSFSEMLDKTYFKPLLLLSK